MAKHITEDLSQAEVQTMIEEFESKLERLRVRYEQYFLGIERIAPSVMRTDVVRVMRKLEHMRINNTALKFRVRGLVQKFHTYSNYWNRTLREIESGTYKRHVQKAQRRMAEHEARAVQSATASPEQDETPKEANREVVEDISNAAEEFLASLGGGFAQVAKPEQAGPKKSMDFDFDDDDDDDFGFNVRPSTGLRAAGLDPFATTSSTVVDAKPPARVARPSSQSTLPPPPQSARPTSPPRQAPLRPPPPKLPPPRTPRPQTPPPPPPPRPRAESNQARQVYDEFVATRKKLGITRSTVEFDRFEKSLQAQAAQVKRSYNCKEVDFRVVVKNGQAILKPVPKS